MARDGVLLDARRGDASRRHAERLPGDLAALLADHGHTWADVTLLAAVSGPGGFTGLRVGLATVQGLAVALDRRVYLASTLDLLALTAERQMPDAPWVGAWMAGMRGEVFAALYRRAHDSVTPAVPPAVGAPHDLADGWAEVAQIGTVALAGDAWPGEAAALQARFGDRVQPCEAPPLAGVLAEEAARRADEAVVPAAVRPAYIRRPDCVVAREEAGQPLAGEP